MHFRTVSDLFACARRNSHKLPRDIEVVVGVPRSGILAACAVSLAMQKPFVDLGSFVQGGETLSLSGRRGVDQTFPSAQLKSALVIDDSIYKGGSLRAARKIIEASGRCSKATYAAIYGTSLSQNDADIILEVCPTPRVFEWNVMNHWSLEFACVDLDGVLCIDPTKKENDDGPRYVEFIRQGKLLNAPEYVINSIVTSRLEKYRDETERWLRANNVRYRNLFMLDLETAAERIRSNAHASFKGQVYKDREDCRLFIESELNQAIKIAHISSKSVLAYKDMRFIPEGGMMVAGHRLRRLVAKALPDWSKELLKAALRAR